jgi:hypothetical protein
MEALKASLAAKGVAPAANAAEGSPRKTGTEG